MISMVRILLTPVFAVLYVRGALWQALGVLLLCAVSDVLDGAIARRFNMVSTLGKILDPLADKITQFTLTVCLSLKHPPLFPVFLSERVPFHPERLLRNFLYNSPSPRIFPGSKGFFTFSTAFSTSLCNPVKAKKVHKFYTAYTRKKS